MKNQDGFSFRDAQIAAERFLKMEAEQLGASIPRWVYDKKMGLWRFVYAWDEKYAGGLTNAVMVAVSEGEACALYVPAV